jgi:hypothetical protein
MSLLEQQIKELQLKKAKADFFKFLQQNLETLPVGEDFKEISGEVLAEMIEFIMHKIEEIESGKLTPPKEEAETLFTLKEANILKALAARAEGKTATTSTTSNTFGSDEARVPPKPETPGQKAKRQDMIQFALANRHLEKKRVRVITSQGEVGGVVVGMIAPNIIVKTDTGHEVPVDLDNLIVE